MGRFTVDNGVINVGGVVASICRRGKAAPVCVALGADILSRLRVLNDKVARYTMAGRMDDVRAVEAEMRSIVDGVVARAAE